MKIGDPSGRLSARDSKSEWESENNLISISLQCTKLWVNAKAALGRLGSNSSLQEEPEFLNNAQWYDKAKFIDILSTLGPGIRVGAMLGRDSSVFANDPMFPGS